MSHFRIKELLKEKDLTSKELAIKLGITENGLSLIINGKRQPRFELLESISRELNVPIWQLFSGSGNSFNGFVEYKGTIHKIQSREDLKRLLDISKT